MRIRRLTIKNYRTLEDIDLRFTGTYTAICGQNDCGKTNVVRAIRSLFREHDAYGYRDFEEVSAKEDLPKWKTGDAGERLVQFRVEVSLDKDSDVGLFQFIVKHLEVGNAPEQELCFTLLATFHADRSDPQVEVEIDNLTVSGIDAQQVLKTIRSSRTVLFHNSTTSEPKYLGRGRQGIVRDLSGESQVLLEKMKESINKNLKKVAKKHQGELGELLGRLESKYRVGLSLPDFDIGFLPYNITLGQKHFDVPLDEWGSGTQNRTMILMTLFRARQTSQSEASASKVTPIIVVEEPESFLHPSAQAEFGRILQDLSEEFQVQVLVTTHSPYMLSREMPTANLLLKRNTSHGQIRETTLVDTSGDRWMEPFSLILGLTSEEFAPWKSLFFSKGESVLFVEGESDREYFEMLRDPAHGPNQLRFSGGDRFIRWMWQHPKFGSP